MDRLFTAVLKYLAHRGVCHADGCTYARKAVCSCGLAEVRAAVKAHAQDRADERALVLDAVVARIEHLEDYIRAHVKAKAAGWPWRDEDDAANKIALERYKALRVRLEKQS